MIRIKIIYWVSTSIVTVVMLFSIYKQYSPDYEHFHLPNYLRTELTIAKLIGMVVFLIPQFYGRIKEWAYAGFGIVLISAVAAHYSSGDGAASFEPLIFLAILSISNIYWNKLNNLKTNQA